MFCFAHQHRLIIHFVSFNPLARLVSSFVWCRYVSALMITGTNLCQFVISFRIAPGHHQASVFLIFVGVHAVSIPALSQLCNYNHITVRWNTILILNGRIWANGSHVPLGGRMGFSFLRSRVISTNYPPIHPPGARPPGHDRPSSICNIQCRRHCFC